VGYKAYLKKLEVAKRTADKAIKLMAEKKIWVADNATAENAMRNAIEIMESQIGSTQSRLAAAKIVLEYTQVKPVTRNETTLKTAEEFLASIIEDEE
jgi:methanogenic corrinoid protein MtbC1